MNHLYQVIICYIHSWWELYSSYTIEGHDSNGYPRVNVLTMEHHRFEWVNQLSAGIDLDPKMRDPTWIRINGGTLLSFWPCFNGIDNVNMIYNMDVIWMYYGCNTDIFCIYTQCEIWPGSEVVGWYVSTIIIMQDFFGKIPWNLGLTSAFFLMVGTSSESIPVGHWHWHTAQRRSRTSFL